MQDKKKQILDAAIHCFARKGYNATTIQEIVDELGMAKGSIYFYFKSKDDLLISIFEYYSEMMLHRMEVLPEEAGLPPREKLVLQWERQFQFFREHLDFMMMLIKEPLTGLHPHIQGMMIRLRARSQVWNVSNLLAIYGSSVEDYLADASALMSGIVSQYFEAIVFEKKKFDESRLSRFMVRRIDDLISGIIRAKETPILPPMDLANLRTLAGLTPEISNAKTDLIQKIMDLIVDSDYPGDESTQRDMLAALALLKEEFVKPLHKNHLIIRAMLALLKQNSSDQLDEPLKLLEQSLLGNPV
ncbi:TetR/AcrR family transcriptional regulator [Cohnella mopanensis]|uniref:TetR/AcrR family transcriptional regulator n=1 Tax=Cohnella mopanensis TaxID=2911966 RepID=UPI001EF8E932|nr:TetR/AcrR family transcriptional regulator [Cohnella mopanensis]